MEDAYETSGVVGATAKFSASATKNAISSSITTLAAGSAPEACLSGALFTPPAPIVGCGLGVAATMGLAHWSADKAGELGSILAEFGTEKMAEALLPVESPQLKVPTGWNITTPELWNASHQ